MKTFSSKPIVPALRLLNRLRICLTGSLLVLSVLLLSAPNAQAYDYLEHSYFGDRACLDAQTRLAARIAGGRASYETVTRYLALALACPERWERHYCVDGDKQAEGGLNRLEAPPTQSGDLAATFGDYVALPDHLSRFGPIHGLPRLGKFGLTFDTWEWLTAPDRDAGGVIGSVADKACRDSEMVPWRRVEADIEATLRRFDKNGLEAVPGSLLSPLTHAPVPPGPSDPAAIYSFNNPHYLDLVLRNHDHFGQYAFGAWLGFHSAAVSAARYTCEDLIDFDVDQLEDLAENMPEYRAIDWGGLSVAVRAKKGCDMMRESIHKRLLEWQMRADPKLVAPVKAQLKILDPDDPKRRETAERRALLDGVSAATTALVLEGVGLHFMQDGLAAGHMRTIRAKGQLEVVRYDHNSDNQNGVVALLKTRSGEYPFLAFGDTYLLGPALMPQFVDCNWADLAHGTPSPRLVTNCLIQHQRGILVATSSASLVDWALDGTLYEAPRGDISPPNAARSGTIDHCANPDTLLNFVCRTLPARATLTPGLEDAGSEVVSARMQHGTIPVPPPPFAYQSLMIDVGVEATGDASQFGLHLNLLEELDSRANWMVSHSIGARTTLGDTKFNQISLDYAYSFHWRWAARFSIDARNSIFTGLQHLNDDPSFFAGVAPGVGITLLPEGWMKLPLEVSVSYRLPLHFFSSKGGFFADDIVNGHWIILGLGLAYM